MSSREDEITAWFAEQSKLDPAKFPIGIGDDMAQIQLSKDCSVLITTDMLLDGVHFDLSSTSLEDIGYKAMAVSLSDCAAMATQPICAVVAVAMPKGYGGDELKQLHRGIVEAGEKYDCKLIGGDITAWKKNDPFAINVTMLSRPITQVVKRSTAKVGDCICVTGTLGGSVKGKHLRFEPRIKEAIKLTEITTINSMMDISDGLSTDLNRICKASKVGAIIESNLIPVSEIAGKTENPLNSALNDGEDFELLFTVSQSGYETLQKKWNEKVAITRIGQITDTQQLQIKDRAGQLKELMPAGFDHLG
jgi:thiamine-monophosphate kinase